ncbi:MAG: dipeptide/oligopeptide/nickel ABC transporter permease/ATP-binding protein [Micrococcaceae bacterium]|nr:dipeptide/oligopeptide/nickel ABC transporter permease/ATP-binding protein [Micrococcaceae bacterium]
MLRVKKGRRLGASMWAGIVLFLILVIIAVVAPITLSGPATQLTQNASLPPSAEHWLGTDDFGRDNAARALVATRLTLIMTATATVISIGGGVIVGVGVWLMPRRPREACLRIIDTAAAYPSLIFAIVVASILTSNATSAVVAIGLAGIPAFARLMSNLAAGISAREYVTTARLLGVSPLRIATRHVLPNISEPLLILTATVFALSLVDLSALSFVGLGVQSPEFDYGRLLNDSLSAMYVQPFQSVGVSVLIVATGLAAMLVGDALAGRSNPRLQGQQFRRGKKPSSAPKQQAEIGGAGSETAIVRVEDLRVSTNSGYPLVKGVSFSIEPGQVVALVGESGSGKSLTAMSIAGLPAEGLVLEAEELSFGGMNMLGKLDRQRLSREMAIIYQDPGSTFNPAMRMGTQLTEVLRTHYGMSRRRSRDLIGNALENVGIDESRRRMKQRPHEFSGGMRQRAMIAAAMSTEAKLLIADEPTTALDVTVQLQVLQQLRRAHREDNMAMLFISHDLGVVQEISDIVLVMKDGEIIERLTADQLRRGQVEHPYTQKLLDSVPKLSQETVAAMNVGIEAHK